MSKKKYVYINLFQQMVDLQKDPVRMKRLTDNIRKVVMAPNPFFHKLKAKDE